MKDKRKMLWLGLWLMLVPLLGVPTSWKSGLIVFTGLWCAAAGARGFWQSLAADAPDSSVEKTRRDDAGAAAAQFSEHGRAASDSESPEA